MEFSLVITPFFPSAIILSFCNLHIFSVLLDCLYLLLLTYLRHYPNSLVRIILVHQLSHHVSHGGAPVTTTSTDDHHERWPRDSDAMRVKNVASPKAHCQSRRENLDTC